MARLTESDVVKLIDSLSNWGRWGADDELGTINHITTAVRRRAAALVRDGVPVTCARPIVTNDIAVDTTIQPAARGSEVPAGAGVMPEDLEAAERAQQVRVEPGDVVLIRTGYYARRLREPRHPTRDGSPAADVACLPWLHERSIAMLGSDTHNDVSPLPYPRLGNALHVVALVGMGLWLIDNANLEDLARACAERRRWEFLLTIAPLRLQHTTGSPVNPIAVF